MSNIEWTEETLNVARGCSRESPGCLNCYAEREAYRLERNPNPKTQSKYDGLTVLRGKRPGWSGEVNFDPETLAKPFGWKKPRFVFVNSMSDLFHPKLTNEQIAAVFGMMAACDRHTFQVLTKRAVRMSEWFEWVVEQGDPREVCVEFAAATFRDRAEPVPKSLGIRGPWPLPNVWLGVSVEDRERMLERVPVLMLTPAAVRWVSAEPLLEEVSFDRWLKPPGETLDWIVCGGESGPGARPCNTEWLQKIVDEFTAAGVPCFVKQLGAAPFDGYVGEGYKPNALTLRSKKGGDPREWPETLRVRQMPRGSNAAPPAEPVPPKDPHAELRAIGRRCAAMLGREHAVRAWQAAKLPGQSASAEDVLKALHEVQLFEAKAKAYVALETYVNVLRSRGIPVAVPPPHWPQMQLRTLQATVEMRRRKLADSIAGGEPGVVLTPREVAELAAAGPVKVGETGSGLREVRYRPGLPITTEEIVAAHGDPTFGARLDGEVTTDEDGLQVYRLVVHRETS